MAANILQHPNTPPPSEPPKPGRYPKKVFLDAREIVKLIDQLHGFRDALKKRRSKLAKDFEEFCAQLDARMLEPVPYELDPSEGQCQKLTVVFGALDDINEAYKSLDALQCILASSSSDEFTQAAQAMKPAVLKIGQVIQDDFPDLDSIRKRLYSSPEDSPDDSEGGAA